MAKLELRQKARELREGGESYKEIALALKVSTSTVSLWCRDIQLSEEKIKVLENRMKDPNYGRRWKYLNRLREIKAKDIEKNVKLGEDTIGKLSKRDFLVAGAALYWAEGFKKDKMVGFSNMDPDMIRFMIGWFTDELGVKKNDLRLRVVLNESHKYRAEEIIEYWASLTKIPKECFYNPTYQKEKWKKIYDKPENYYGVLRIRVLKSTNLLRKITGMCHGLKGCIEGNSWSRNKIL